MEKKKYTQDDIEKFKDYLSDIQTEIENGIKPQFVDDELLKSIKETVITWKVYNDLGKAISDLWTNKDFVKAMTGFEDWKTLHQESFKKSVKSLKHIFKKHHTPIPHDWEKVFYDWYLLKHPDLEKTPLHLIPPMDETEIFNWAKEYSENFLNQKDESEAKEEKIHSQKTRIDLEPKYRFYLMEKLGMIDPKGIFYDPNLSLNQRAELLSKILGYNERDCKSLLNGKATFNDEKKLDLDDLLNDLIKKRKK